MIKYKNEKGYKKSKINIMLEIYYKLKKNNKKNKQNIKNNKKNWNNKKLFNK